jgi:hypothetical protein
MQVISTRTQDLSLDVHANGLDARHCTVGEPVAIESSPVIERVQLDDQPGGAPAISSASEITCIEPGEHRFVVHFAGGVVGGLRLIAHEKE